MTCLVSCIMESASSLAKNVSNRSQVSTYIVNTNGQTIQKHFFNRFLIYNLLLEVYKHLNHFPTKPWFSCVCCTSPLKTMWEKEKLLIMINFSFSHSIFYQFQKLSAIFIKFEIVIHRLFQFGRA